ncbi:hypothetical protein N7510_006148 [Penicillium lagena]|uniref:uncharacterized protein n=1 Tax=Penicillium lagena TaxID=94218 RepID=UPI0025400F5F|nr:uncharacterized protein N7510_006148 [Penicillium lagena]KAJ5612954.1 hypothetical protein N7510_006148 [Penicillium lagena]
MSKSITLITGANSGIGYATTQVIASHADYHVIMGCRDLDKGKTALSEIQASGIQGTLSLLQLDVTSESSISAAVDEVARTFGHVDVFISNAGTTSQSESGLDKLKTIFDVNVFGAMLVSEAFVPLLLKSGRPYLIQISSGLGSLGMAADPKYPIYQSAWDEYRMSKAALNMMTLQMHKRLSAQNIRVFAVCPGLVRSRLRGESEAAISAGGAAGDPVVSGKLIMDIILGKRDDNVGEFVNKDGTYPW